MKCLNDWMKMISNNEKHFEAKNKSDWLKLFEICFKFVSFFFLNQFNESGNSKSGLKFEKKRVMCTMIAYFFHPKKKLLELNPTKLGLKPLIKFWIYVIAVRWLQQWVKCIFLCQSTCVLGPEFWNPSKFFSSKAYTVYSQMIFFY